MFLYWGSQASWWHQWQLVRLTHRRHYLHRTRRRIAPLSGFNNEVNWLESHLRTSTLDSSCPSQQASSTNSLNRLTGTLSRTDRICRACRCFWDSHHSRSVRVTYQSLDRILLVNSRVYGKQSTLPRFLSRCLARTSLKCTVFRDSLPSLFHQLSRRIHWLSTLLENNNNNNQLIT